MARRRSAEDVPPRERVRAILGHMDRFDNTAQYGWFLEIARDVPRLQRRPRHRRRRRRALRRGREDVRPAGLGGAGLRQVEAREDLPDQRFRRPARRLRHATLRPCLRTDDLVFHLDKPEVRAAAGRRRPASRSATRPVAAEGDRQAVRALHGRRGRRRAPSRCRPTSRRRRVCDDERRSRAARSRCGDDGRPTATPRRGRRLLDAGRALPRVQAAVRPDDRRQPPRLRGRRLPGAGPVRPADAR